VADLPAASAGSPLPAGYEFIRVLGGGGCGWVALARQSALNRMVAVKTLYAGRYDEDERRRLEREGRALARLRDPRIVAVYAMETVGEDLCLVLEFVDGTDLREALDEGMVDGPARLRILTDVAAALDHAAHAGIVHRDVKPANVLLSRAGVAKLTDFGLARMTAAAGAFRTAGAVVIGTPRYMPPEQIMDPERESPAGDAYSFAAMAYEAMVGAPPFQQTDTLALFWHHTNAAPPSPRTVLPTVSAEAEAVLMAGLAKDPAMRPMPGQVMAVLNAHPEDWTQHVATAPMPDRSAATPTVRAGVPPTSPSHLVTGPASQIVADPSVPWVQVPVYQPPVQPRRLRVPPALIGVLVVVAIVAIVLLVI
jgi:serine/threonine protein kinase